MKVNEIMSAEPLTLNQEATLLEAAQMMIDKQISIVPITDDSKKLLGVITQSDFVGKQKEIPHALVTIKELFGKDFHNRDIEEIYKESKNTPVSEIMTTHVKSVKPTDEMNFVVNMMIKNNLKRIPVLDDGEKLVGIVTRRNILSAFIKA